MDEIIDRIIAIEDEAQRLIKDAKEEKANLGQVIEGEVESMHKDMEERIKKKQETLKDYEDEEVEKKISEINKKLSENMEKIDKKAAEKKESWIEDLVNNVIG